MRRRNARVCGKAILGSWATTLPRTALIGILALAPNSLWSQEKAQKDASKDKELSITVQGPGTDAR